MTDHEEMMRDYETCPAPDWETGELYLGNFLTIDHLRIEAVRRFGEDPKKWAFQCPRCSDIATVQDFIDLGSDPGRCGQECVGRILGSPDFDSREGSTARGCNWVAYGLFYGPWYVLYPSVEGVSDIKKIYTFRLAPAPEDGAS